MCTKVLSVDLAYTDYDSIGICLLCAESGAVSCVTYPGILDEMEGVPDPNQLANTLCSWALSNDVQVMLLDGPQGWSSDPERYRLCERECNTPAKTYGPGVVKPANYLSFVQFSVDVFWAMVQRKEVSVLAGATPIVRQGRILLCESFPLNAWRRLGLPGLPAKAKCKPAQLQACHQALLERCAGLPDTGSPNHDQLQALITGLAGVGLTRDNAYFSLHGMAPQRAADHLLEGFILHPAWPPIETAAGGVQ